MPTFLQQHFLPAPRVSLPQAHFPLPTIIGVFAFASCFRVPGHHSNYRAAEGLAVVVTADCAFRSAFHTADGTYEMDGDGIGSRQCDIRKLQGRHLPGGGYKTPFYAQRLRGADHS